MPYSEVWLRDTAVFASSFVHPSTFSVRLRPMAEILRTAHWSVHTLLFFSFWLSLSLPFFLLIISQLPSDWAMPIDGPFGVMYTLSPRCSFTTSKYEHNHQEKMYNRISFLLQLNYYNYYYFEYDENEKKRKIILFIGLLLSAPLHSIQFTWLLAFFYSLTHSLTHLLSPFLVTLNWNYRVFAWIGKRLNDANAFFFFFLKKVGPDFVIFAIMMIVLLDIRPFAFSLFFFFLLLFFFFCQLY